MISWVVRAAWCVKCLFSCYHTINCNSCWCEQLLSLCKSAAVDSGHQNCCGERVKTQLYRTNTEEWERSRVIKTIFYYFSVCLAIAQNFSDSRVVWVIAELCLRSIKALLWKNIPFARIIKTHNCLCMCVDLQIEKVIPKQFHFCHGKIHGDEYSMCVPVAWCYTALM